MTVNPPTPLSADSTCLTTLPNGVRLVALPLPHVDTVSVSVFVRTGSRDEPLRLNGISHVVEHMAFKGTARRNCQQINLDAEALGAEVNAHTDKDHTAYHMRGLAADLPAFVDMLAEIVLDSTFPEAELERERRVILQEFAEDEDDAFSTASKLFDKACSASTRWRSRSSACAATSSASRVTSCATTCVGSTWPVGSSSPWRDGSTRPARWRMRRGPLPTPRPARRRRPPLPPGKAACSRGACRG